MRKTTASLLLILAACSKIPAPEIQALYSDMAGSSGLIFHHEPGDRGQFFFPEGAAGGVALLDFDGDGDLDIFFVQSGFLGEDAPEQPANVLFRNEIDQSSLIFTDVTSASELARTGYGMGAAVADYDNDGDTDLYITAFGPNHMLRNNADGTFTDVTETTDTNDERWSTSAAFFDYDNDSDLDLFVSNYVAFSVSHNKRCSPSTGEHDYCGPKSYEAVADRLFRNRGGSKFVDVTNEAGLHRAYGPGLGVTISDLDNNGLLDVYVANDGAPNQLWLNNGAGFADRGLMFGAAYNAEGMTEASMGVSAGDYDGDGDDDLFMTHLRNETNTLYENDGTANFIDVTRRVAIGAPGRRMTGFGTAWLDYDNDGLLDLFVANGAVVRVPGQTGDFPYREPNQLFRNVGGKFVDVSEQAGPDVTVELVSRGAAFGDIDNDGDTDIVVVNANGPAQLLINQVGNQAEWVGVDLRGGGASGNHARVGVATAERILWRTSRRDGSYLSSSDPRVLIGLGERDLPVDVLVRWRNKPAEVWVQRPLRRYHALTPGGGTLLAQFCDDRSHKFCTD